MQERPQQTPVGAVQRVLHHFLWVASDIWTVLNGVQIIVTKLLRWSPSAELWDDPLPTVPYRLCMVLSAGPELPCGSRASLSPCSLALRFLLLSALRFQHGAGGKPRLTSCSFINSSAKKTSCALNCLILAAALMQWIHWRGDVFHKTDQLCRTVSISFKIAQRKLCKHITDSPKDWFALWCYWFAFRCWFLALQQNALGTSPTCDMKCCSARGKGGASHMIRKLKVFGEKRTFLTRP